MMKQPYEAYTVTYDFAPRLGAAQIGSVVSVVSTPRGGGANMLAEAWTPAGQTVLVKWTGGIDGEGYLTTVRVLDGNGDAFEVDGVIEVRERGFPVEPVSLDEAKRQLRLDDDADDALVGELIPAAREWVENYTGLVLTRRQVVQAFDGFGAFLDLHAWPLVSVDAVTWRDAAGADQVVQPETYVVMSAARPGRIVSPAGRWPAASGRGSVTVTATAGYAPEAVPALLKRAMLVVLTGLHDTPEGLSESAEKAARALCAGHKVWRV